MNTNEIVDKQIVQRMFHKSQRPIFTWQSDGSLLKMNKMFKEFYDTDELTVQQLIANDDCSIFESIINCLSTSNYMTLESFVSSNEDTHRVLWSHILTYDDKHNKHEIFSIGEVIEDLKLNAHLYNILYDRYAFEKTASQLFSEDKVFTIYLIDIDDFKKINDTFGHLVGDKTIILIAELLKNNIRQSDSLGRWGGEEFLIICPETNLSEAEVLANKLCQQIGLLDFPHEEQCTASFGVTTSRKKDKEEDAFIRADKALYLAKEEGKNRVKSL